MQITQFDLKAHLELEHNFRSYCSFRAENSTLIKEQLADVAKPGPGVYAIIVDNKLEYIGKSSDVYRRMGYYKTSHNRSTPHTDKTKSEAILKAASEGLSVIVLFVQVNKSRLVREDYDSKGSISRTVVEEHDYSTFEEKLIRLYKPNWNTMLK